MNERLLRVIIKRNWILTHIIVVLFLFFMTSILFKYYDMSHLILFYFTFYLVITFQWYTSIKNIKEFLGKTNLNQEEEGRLKIEISSFILYYIAYIWIPLCFIVVSMVP
jgi:hypothetical protein